MTRKHSNYTKTNYKTELDKPTGEWIGRFKSKQELLFLSQ